MRGQQDMNILVIGGSDSSSGAGVQADIKTAAALGVYACCAVTCVTAQNTRVFAHVEPISPASLRAQIAAVFDDIAPAAVKVGMLPAAEQVCAVADALRAHGAGGRGAVPVVIDPVLGASVADTAVAADLTQALRTRLFDLATLVTPNLPELWELCGTAHANRTGVRAAARALLADGAHAVLVKGGHGGGSSSVDVLFMDGGDEREFASPRRAGAFHGTGCLLSTAACCALACGLDMPAAVAFGKRALDLALSHVHALGSGQSLLNQAMALQGLDLPVQGVERGNPLPVRPM